MNQMRPRFSKVRFAAKSILLGMLLNLLVGWGLSIAAKNSLDTVRRQCFSMAASWPTPKLPSSARPLDSKEAASLLPSWIDPSGAQQLLVIERRAAGGYLTLILDHSEIPPLVDGGSIQGSSIINRPITVDVVVGWPVRNLHFQLASNSRLDPPLSETAWALLPANDTHGLDRPLLPMRHEITASTIAISFWAVIAAVVCGARPAYRRLTHRCALCGYLLRERYAIGCPECGWNRD